MTPINSTTSKHSELDQKDRIHILEYEGVMTQNVITTCIDNIEQKVDNINILGKLSTIVIELCQNMMNYSKSKQQQGRELAPEGSIYVTQNIEQGYYITSRNIVSIEDKQKIELILIEIKKLDLAGIKKRYRELRRSGKNAHKKGGGIGFYEISKLVSSLEYEFTMINLEKFYFDFKLFVSSKIKS